METDGRADCRSEASLGPATAKSGQDGAQTRGIASDEHYVVDLCDEILGLQASRQHCFPWLCGDPNDKGRRKKLPLDAYYPPLKLVIEYDERQHGSSVPHWNRERTVSGVDRDGQRLRVPIGVRDNTGIVGQAMLCVALM